LLQVLAVGDCHLLLLVLWCWLLLRLLLVL
jgi:hypothetical protein